MRSIDSIQDLQELLIDEDEQRLEQTVQELSDEGKRYGLNMNFEKTKQWYLVKKTGLEKWK